MRTKLIVGTFMALSVFSNISFAGNGGEVKDYDLVGGFNLRSVVQNPGVTWTFSTSGLSAGGDTVINVQNLADPQIGFVAGNDDEAPGILSSRVVVPPASSARTLFLIVRAWSGGTQGTCTVTGTPSSGSGAFSAPGVSFGGSVYGFPTSLGARSHITTAERQGTGTDTVLLAYALDPAHAIAYDNNSGVGAMALIRLGEACSPCRVAVAHIDNRAPGKTNLIWDEDAETNDEDGDGLGLGLEVALHTDPKDRDSDHDGLDDGLEVYGRDSGTILKMPAWGADPTQQDIFVEADWQRCIDPSCSSPDRYKIGGAPDWSPTTVDTMAQIKQWYLPMRIHSDIGIVNTDPATREDWGNWGGAERHDTSGACDGFTESRKGLFRHLMVGFPEISTGIGSPCSNVTAFPGNIAHEMGHGFGLQHGGRPEDLALNYKMNYASTMNYGYDVKHFSHGGLPTLNPTRLDETFGLGTSDMEVMDNVKNVFCAGQPAGKCVSGQMIDWNRDGVFSPSASLVRGTISINYTAYNRSKFDLQLNDPAMTWVSPGGFVGDQLWIFGRGPSNQLQYTAKARVAIEQGCGGVTPLGQLTDQMQDCAGFGGRATNYPGNKIIAFAPGVAELGGGAFIVVTQPTGGGPLVSNVIHLNGGTGQVTFDADVALPGASTTGDVTALATGSGTVSVWAPVNNRLMEWSYANGAWSGPTAQQWVSNPFNPQFINPLYGIGATRGFVSSSSSAQTFAAIPTAPNGVVEFARKTGNGQWSKVTSSWAGSGSVGVQPTVQGRPGLAYMRMDPTQPATTGRFYLGLNLSDACESSPPYPFGSASNTLIGCESRMVFTEGNVDTAMAATRRLVWVNPGTKLGATADEHGSLHATRGVALLGDLTRSKNLMAAKTYQSTPPGAAHASMEFSPLADGIINANMADIDEYLYIETNLAARVHVIP